MRSLWGSGHLHGYLCLLKALCASLELSEHFTLALQERASHTQTPTQPLNLSHIEQHSLTHTHTHPNG